MRIGCKGKTYVDEGRGPGKSPALPAFVLCLIEAFILTQSAFSFDYQSFQAYTPSLSNGSDAAAGGGRDAQFDSKRAVERFQKRSREEKESQKRGDEKKRDSEQVQEVHQNVAQEQKASRDIAQGQHQEGEAMVSRTTGLDSYSVGKDGSVYREHLALLVEAWNVLSKDLYGDASRSHLTDFAYNDLLNVIGMKRDTVDQAGRTSNTVVSDIAYNTQSLRNFLSENEESGRVETSTTYHPTGNQVTRTKIFDLVYQGDKENKKVVAQKAEIADLSGPMAPILQETFNMKYDGDNVVSSEARVTDLGTGTVTESVTKNEFSGDHLTSGVTTSRTKDAINHTLTEQTFTQKLSYNEGGVAAMDAKSIATTRAMDEYGKPVDDFVTTTETTQTMGVFAGMPNPIEIVSVSKTLDNIAVQITESRQTQRHIRDEHGNLLEVSATEVASTVNADHSVVQNTESNLSFVVRADQSYLTGREDKSVTKDLVNEQDVTSTSRLQVRLDALGRILDGVRSGKSHATNPRGTLVTDSEFTQYFDSATKANALGLVRQRTTSRTVNSVEESITDEVREYTQSHDDANRVLSAGETTQADTTNPRGITTHAEGTVNYAVGKRTNQAYAVLARNKITSMDPINRLQTESVQTNTFESDVNTGRAIRGRGVTEGVSKRRLDDGRILDDAYTVLTRTEEIFVGLSQANGFGMMSRKTHTEAREIANNVVTDRDEILTQAVNSVGKVEGASSVTKSVTQDLGRTGAFQTTALTQTDYRIIGNSPIPIENKTVEVTVSRIDGSYRVIARHDVTRYDEDGRILPIDEKNPDKSGFEILFYKDFTEQLVPAARPSLEQLFHQYFGATGLPR